MLRTTLFAAILLATAAPAWAQDAESIYVPELRTQIDSQPSDQPMGVMDRPRPDYDAKGLPLGAFRLKPALDVAAASDDNVFDTETDTQSDIFYVINPSFDLASDWSRHKLEIMGGLTRYQYQDQGSESRTDWNLGASGRLDVLRGTYLEGETSYAVMHEPRYSPDEPGGASEPTEYAQYHAAASITHGVNRFALQLGGSYDELRFDDTPLIGGGTFSNDDRNERQYGAFAKVSYEVAPGAAVFLRGSLDDKNFDLTVDRDGVDRDSKRYRADIGAEFFATRLIRGQVFAGYVDQRFNDPLPDVSTVDYGAALDWFATPLMTFHVRAARILNDTTIAGASVSDDRTAGLSLDYELLRNLLVHAGGDFTHSDFRGTPRSDELWDGWMSADYLINEYLSARASYRYTHRNSNAAGEDFDDNTVLLGLHFQL